MVDVWESPEAFAAFAQSEIEQAGFGPVEPRIHPVHNTLTGEAATAEQNFVQKPRICSGFVGPSDDSRRALSWKLTR